MTNSNYKLPSIVKPLNIIIGFIFYYRLVVVILGFGGIIFACKNVYEISILEDKLKNAALVLTGGSIVIGIFYSIINYEHSKQKFNHDVKSSREILTFNTACKMHDVNTIEHFRKIKTFYVLNKTLISDGKFKEFDTLLTKEIDVRVSFIVIFNYFECISIGIEQGIMDETFMKSFFKTVFIHNLNTFGPFIDFMKKEYNADRMFWKFTELATKWKSE